MNDIITDIKVLQEETLLNLQSSKANNTVRAYKSDFNDFGLFCAQNGLKSLPSEPKIVSLYLTHLSTKEVKMSTLKRRLVSIGVIHKLKGHHIVCGYGRIGFVICREFRRENRPYAVIENNPDKAAELIDDGIPVVVGDATSDATLIEAGVERAVGLISSMPSDAENVFVALSAKRLNSDLFVVARAVRDSAIPKLQAAGANRVISPYTMGGLRMAESVLRPKLANFFDTIAGYTSKDWDFEETVISDTSSWGDQNLRCSNIGQETGVYILASKRDGEMTFNPGADHIIQIGDTLYAMGRPEQIASLREYLQSGPESAQKE